MIGHEKAYAKINLSLDVLRKRPDGYHDLRMIAQTVDLCDDISIELRKDSTVEARCNLAFLPTDGRNHAVMAAKAFFERTGVWGGGALITIDKRIPVCAGLGGGSADAAAVLRGLNRMFENPLTIEQLLGLAERIGSDVPFCVRGGTQLMEGRGEVLTPLTPLTDCFIVICKPEDPLSTEQVFSRIDAAAVKYHPDNTGMMKALKKGDIKDFSRRMFNCLEESATQTVKEIAVIRKALIDGGALGVCMTGSGSAVIGLFSDGAKSAASRLSATYPETFLTKPVPDEECHTK